MTAGQRRRVEDLVEFLLGLLDADAGDPDLEEGDNGIASIEALDLIEHLWRCVRPSEVAA